MDTCKSIFVRCLVLQTGLNLFFTVFLMNTAAILFQEDDFVIVNLIIGGIQIGFSILLGYFIRNKYRIFLSEEHGQRRLYANIAKVGILILFGIICKPNIIGGFHLAVITLIYRVFGLPYSFTIYDGISLVACLSFVFLGWKNAKNAKIS